MNLLLICLKYTAMKKIKIIIVDDFLMVRTGLNLLLNANEKFEVLAEATDGEDFLGLLDKFSPDIVLMDINMPKMNGIMATKAALLKNPELKIIALSMFEDKESIESMILAGAKGFILKQVGMNELYNAIELVMKGEIYYSQDVMKDIINKLFTKKEEKVQVDDDLDGNALLNYM
jgi:DNA-binding NarL/FixJ family response regulator